MSIAPLRPAELTSRVSALRDRILQLRGYL